MTCLSGGDMRRRLSQRQICADVCHPKWPPRRVSLTGKHDVEMIVYVEPVAPLWELQGATGGLKRSNYVVERVCVHPAWISWRSKVE